MAYIKDYIKSYGKLSFKEMSFSDADNVAMCYMFYMPFEEVVSDSFDDEPVAYSVACNKLFAKRGYKHKPVGLILLKDISVQMMNMANQKRWAQMRMVACKSVIQDEPSVQFNAATFLLPNGDIVVVFRGTDDSLTGWKEDFDILTKESIPSQKLATEYLEEVANKFDGDIIVCGHSKGGYVAQYGALFCKDEVRARIKALYNNDGPGFQDYSFIDTNAYKELLPKYKHFVPQSSLIGMLLYHDDDYQVVKSKRVLGPLQHDLSTWQIEGDEPKAASKLTGMGKINDLALYGLVNNLSAEQEKAFDNVLTTALHATSSKGLIDLKTQLIPTISDSKKACEQLDDGVLSDFRSSLSGFPKSIVNAGHSVEKGEFSTVEERKNK